MELLYKFLVVAMWFINLKRVVNTDVNGFLNIIKKVIVDVFDQGINRCPFSIVVFAPL